MCIWGVGVRVEAGATPLLRGGGGYTGPWIPTLAAYSSQLSDVTLIDDVLDNLRYLATTSETAVSSDRSRDPSHALECVTNTL